MASKHKRFRRTVAWVLLVFAVLFILSAVERISIGKILPGTFAIPAWLVGGALVLFAIDHKTPHDPPA